MEKKELDSKTTIIKLIESCNSNLFPNIHQLLIILATLPITICECERSISILRRLKTFIRSTMTAKNIKCYSDQEIKSECGFNCIINRESDSAYIKLPKIYFFKDKPDNHWASFSWDKSLHQLAEFNKVTPKEEYLTGVVKIIVNLSYPSSVKIMLRKRICFSIVKKASSFFSLFTKKNPKPHGCNVTYNLVSKLPSIVDNAEHLSNLAKKAMSLKGCDDNTQNMPNSHFEKYMLRINSIDYMIKLDKLRQSTIGVPRRVSLITPTNQYVLHNIMKTRDINVSSYLMKSARKRGTSIKAKNHSKKLNSKNSKLFDTSVSLSTSTINLDKIMRKNKNLERLLSVKSKRNTLSSMASLSNEDLFCDKGDANIADVNKNGSDPNIYSTEEPNQETNFEKEYPSTSWSSDKTLIKDSNDFTEDDVSKKSTESINNHVNCLDTIKEDIEKCDSILNDYDEINNFDEIKVSDDNNTDKHINISLEKQNETPSVEIKNKLPIQSIIETDVNENRLIELKQDFDLENSLNANKNKPLFPSTSTIESEMENNKINDNKNDLNYIESTKLNNQNLDFQDERKFSNLSNVSNLTGSGNNLSCNQLDCFRKFSDTKSQLDCIWNMNLKINDAKSNDSSSNISLTNIDDIFELIESEKDIMRIKAKRKSGIQKDSINSADTIKNEITIADNEGCHYKTKDYEKQKKKENLNEKDKIKSKRDKNVLDEQQHINNSKTNKNIILRNLNRSKPIMRRTKTETGRNDLISKELKSSIRDSVLISDSENKNRSSIVTFDMSHLDDQMGTSLEGDNPSKNRRNNKVSETYCSNDEVNKIKPKVCQVSPIDVISRQRLSSSDSNLFNERLISTESTESKQSNKTNPSNIFKIKRLSIKLNRKTNEIKEFELQTDSNNIKDINTPEKFTNDNIDIGTALDNTNMKDHDEKNKLKEVQDVKNIKDIQDINDIQEVNKIEVVNDIEEIQNVDEMIKINQITELKEIESLTSSVSCTDKIIAIEKENELEQLKIQIPKKSNLSNSNESLSSTHTFVMENKDSIENEISTTKETKQKRIKSLKLSSKKSYVVKNSKILTNENTSTEKKSRPTSLYHQSLDKRKSIVNKEKDKDSKSNNLREIKARRKKGKINQNNSHLSLSEKNDSFDLNIKPKSIKKRNTNTVSKISKNRNRISFVSVDRLDKKKILAHGGSDDDSRNTFDIDASSNLGFKRDSYNSLNSEIYQNNDLQYNSDQIDSYASNGTDSPDKCVLSHWMKISSAVHVKSKENEMLKGRIRFIGNTEFASGLWIGVEITHGRGKHDGTVNGKIYFKCRKNKGIFVRPNRLLPDHSESIKTDEENTVLGDYCVNRRFNEFSFLLQYLKLSLPFEVFPVLPEKLLSYLWESESDKLSFLYRRRIGLERFLKKIVQYTILHKNQIFINFLTLKEFNCDPNLLLVKQNSLKFIAKYITTNETNNLKKRSNRTLEKISIYFRNLNTSCSNILNCQMKIANCDIKYSKHLIKIASNLILLSRCNSTHEELYTSLSNVFSKYSKTILDNLLERSIIVEIMKDYTEYESVVETIFYYYQDIEYRIKQFQTVVGLESNQHSMRVNDIGLMGRIKCSLRRMDHQMYIAKKELSNKNRDIRNKQQVEIYIKKFNKFYDIMMENMKHLLMQKNVEITDFLYSYSMNQKTYHTHSLTMWKSVLNEITNYENHSNVT
ncbi:hypothetical protein A3Q56_00958 [Intoshia linei]|uniref:CAP-Gly domain-containing protein n=1 Tax=Intoshia linei TaxID=1819745 RepID=A0A177BC64_9BILA|nr:hypothetical protein A3Q56_00958 [Intoshia linei]